MPQHTKPIYLDHAAATPLDPGVLASMQPYLSDQYFNPSATYQAAEKVRASLDEARALIAHWLGARGSEIIFTAGGTEANNLAIHGVMRRYPKAKVVMSAIEHDSVLAPAERYDYSLAPVNDKGLVDAARLSQLIDDSTVLVSVMYANNEVGSVQPIRELGQRLAAIRRQRQAAGNQLPLYLHSDACQATNYLDLHVARLGVDLLTINGGKIYGPKQSGALYVKAGVRLEPLIDGGGQESGLRSGTENVAASIGLAAALDSAQQQRLAEVARLKALQQQFFKQLQAKLPAAQINGSIHKRLPNNVHITLPGSDNERLLMQLDNAGIQAAAGSACSASSEASSHVLLAMGLNDDQARSSLRFTMGRPTTDQQVAQTVALLTSLVAG